MKQKSPYIKFNKVVKSNNKSKFRYEKTKFNSAKDVLYSKDKTYKKMSVDKSSRFSIFCLFVFLLFLYAYVSYIRTGQVITISFKSLVEWLSEVPDVSSSFVLTDVSIGGDWGLVDVLRNWLNFFISSFSVVVTVCGFIVQALILIIQYTRLFI